jgi:hypothetical protein
MQVCVFVYIVSISAARRPAGSARGKSGHSRGSSGGGRAGGGGGKRIFPNARTHKTTNKKALVFDGVGRIRFVTDQPLPKLERATDAIVKVKLCAICGSDLHPFRGDERGLAPGTGEGCRVFCWCLVL